jgi:hypothetical protein
MKEQNFELKVAQNIAFDAHVYQSKHIGSRNHQMARTVIGRRFGVRYRPVDRVHLQARRSILHKEN